MAWRAIGEADIFLFFGSLQLNKGKTTHSESLYDRVFVNNVHANMEQVIIRG